MWISIKRTVNDHDPEIAAPKATYRPQLANPRYTNYTTNKFCC